MKSNTAFSFEFTWHTRIRITSMSSQPSTTHRRSRDRDYWLVDLLVAFKVQWKEIFLMIVVLAWGETDTHWWVISRPSDSDRCAPSCTSRCASDDRCALQVCSTLYWRCTHNTKTTTQERELCSHLAYSSLLLPTYDHLSLDIVQHMDGRFGIKFGQIVTLWDKIWDILR